jgi:hypothetical protein
MKYVIIDSDIDIDIDIDIEGSGLAGFPIELGWCDRDGSSESHLTARRGIGPIATSVRTACIASAAHSKAHFAAPPKHRAAEDARRLRDMVEIIRPETIQAMKQPARR